MIITIWIPIIATVISILLFIFATPFALSTAPYIILGVGASWLLYLISYTIENFINTVLSGDLTAIIIVIVIALLVIWLIQRKR